MSRKIALIGLFAIMPIVDSLNGILQSTAILGQIYRIAIIIIMMTILRKYNRKMFSVLTILLLLYLIIQFLIGGLDYGINNVQVCLRLFTPIFIISTIDILIDKDKFTVDDVHVILDIWAVLYPLFIIVPGMLNIGSYAYERNTGYKGFFYAINEISFVIVVLVLYCIFRYAEEGKIKHLVLYITNCLTVILMGTKTGYATIVVSIILFLFSPFFYKMNRSNKKRLLFFLGTILVGIVVCCSVFKSQITRICKRWFRQRSLSYSIIDFLLSMRLRRMNTALNDFINTKWFYPIIGWGFMGELVGFQSLEMDFFDLLFRTGVLGFVGVISVYWFIYFKKIKLSYWSICINIWMFAVIFGAGHVLFYGQSGMAFAIFCLCFIEYRNKCKELVAQL